MSLTVAFIALLSIFAFIFFFIFLFLCLGGILGFLKFINPLLTRLVSSNHDRTYSSDTEPINAECFICLERITNEVVASCNHSYCGKVGINAASCILDYAQAS